MSAKRDGPVGSESDSSRLVRRQLHYLADEAWGVLADATNKAGALTDEFDASAGVQHHFVRRPTTIQTAFRTKNLGLLRRLHRPWFRGRA